MSCDNCNGNCKCTPSMVHVLLVEKKNGSVLVAGVFSSSDQAKEAALHYDMLEDKDAWVVTKELDQWAK